jgi:hypothetical protein
MITSQNIVSSNYKHTEWLLVRVWDLEKRTVLIWKSWTIYRDLNKMLFSNVVDQAAQKTEYYLGYYMGEGGG